MLQLWWMEIVFCHTPDGVQEKMRQTGIALAKLRDHVFTVKHGIKSYLENNLTSLSSDSGMQML